MRNGFPEFQRKNKNQLIKMINRILCSVYYPHSKLSTLLKHGVLPLFESLYTRKEIFAFNYFLSMYKGENIVLQWYYNRNDNPDYLKRMVETNITDFLLNYRSEYIKEALPVNRLFLNMQPNTVHFWDRDPFIDRQIFNNNEDAELQFRTTLSHLCLIELSRRENLGGEEIFTVYIQLLLIFLSLHNGLVTGRFTHFLEKLLDKIKGIKHDSLLQINRIEHKIHKDYLEFKDYYSNHFKSLLSIIDSGDTKFGDTIVTGKWISFIKDVMMVNNRESNKPPDEFMINLFLIISQKISLHVDRLIASISMIREFHVRN